MLTRQGEIGLRGLLSAASCPLASAPLSRLTISTRVQTTLSLHPVVSRLPSFIRRPTSCLIQKTAIPEGTPRSSNAPSQWQSSKQQKWLHPPFEDIPSVLVSQGT